MLSKLSTHFSNNKSRILNYFSSKTYHSASGFCCISITSQTFSFVYTRKTEGKITIEIGDIYPYKNENELIAALTDIVKNNRLKLVPCSLILQPEDYQLLITDALPVAAEEFQAAIRWKIKDLIHFPLHDVVIDSFDMPRMKNSTNKIMIVAAQISKLEKLRNQIQQSGLNLKFIDIPELALRNIAILYAKEDNTSALIYVQDNGIQLLFIAQQQIYIARLLKINLDNKDADTLMQGMERLAAEIQRSYNYYQSLWDMPIPSYFLFASTKLIGQEATELLSQRIMAPVQIINIQDILIYEPKVSLDEQGKLLPVIGGALREKVQHAAAS